MNIKKMTYEELENKLSDRIKRESKAHRRRLTAESELGEISESLCELIQVMEHLKPCEAILNRAKLALRYHCESCQNC